MVQTVGGNEKKQGVNMDINEILNSKAGKLYEGGKWEYVDEGELGEGKTGVLAVRWMVGESFKYRGRLLWKWTLKRF